MCILICAHARQQVCVCRVFFDLISQKLAERGDVA